MSLTRGFRTLLMACVVMAVFTYAVAVTDPVLMVWALPGAVFGWWLSERAGHPLPKPVVHILTGCAVVYAVLSWFTRGGSAAIVCDLAVYLLLIKLADRKTTRDEGQFLTLSFFLLIGAMLTSNALLLMPLLLVMMPMLIAAVMLYQIRLAQDRAARARALIGPGPQAAGPGPVAPAGRRLGRHIVLTTAAATLAAFTAATGVFLFVPRGIGANALGRWGNPTLGGAGLTGFTDRIQLGGASWISESSAVVMDMSVQKSRPRQGPGGGSKAAEDLRFGGPGSVFYLRGAVLTDYEEENGRWLPAQKPPQWQEVPPEQDTPVGTDGNGIAIDQHITMRSVGRTSALFSVWRPVGATFAQGCAIAVGVPDAALRRQGTAGRVEYSIHAVVGEQQGAGREEDWERRPVAFHSRPVRELAEQILSEAHLSADASKRPTADDPPAARAFEGYLRTHYSYTLHGLSVPEGRQPLDWFLFDSRRGNCEFFASAMAALCRSVGINARVITGFVAAEYNPVSGRYVVRARNAHAWVEAETAHRRWDTFDPTPSADFRAIHQPPIGVFGRVRQAIEATEQAWNASFAAFDERSRASLVHATEPGPDAAPARVVLFVQALNAGGLPLVLRALLNAGLVFSAAALALLAAPPGLLALLAGVRRRRAIRRAAATDPQLPIRLEQSRFYARLLQALAARGHAKPSWRPPLLHVRGLRPADPALADLAAQATRTYYAIRYGRRLLTPDELAHVQGLIERVRADGSGNLGGESVRA
jgi:hypothetical protein